MRTIGFPGWDGTGRDETRVGENVVSSGKMIMIICHRYGSAILYSCISHCAMLFSCFSSTEHNLIHLYEGNNKLCITNSRQNVRHY